MPKDIDTQSYEYRKARFAANPKLAEKERERQRKVSAEKRSENREAYNAYMREWTAKNAERLNAERRAKRANDPEYAEKLRQRDRDRWEKRQPQRRNALLEKNYGITAEEYSAMYEKQEGRCLICNQHKPDKGKNGLVVDHCHTAGHVRGLLCGRCNSAIGLFDESIEALQNAIKYLERK